MNIIILYNRYVVEFTRTITIKFYFRAHNSFRHDLMAQLERCFRPVVICGATNLYHLLSISFYNRNRCAFQLLVSLLIPCFE